MLPGKVLDCLYSISYYSLQYALSTTGYTKFNWNRCSCDSFIHSNYFLLWHAMTISVAFFPIPIWVGPIVFCSPKSKPNQDKLRNYRNFPYSYWNMTYFQIHIVYSTADKSLNSLSCLPLVFLLWLIFNVSHH